MSARIQTLADLLERMPYFGSSVYRDPYYEQAKWLLEQGVTVDSHPEGEDW